MPDIPDAAFRAAETAIREKVRLRLKKNALAAVAEGRPIMLAGAEAEDAARAALEAAAPFIAEQARREAAETIAVAGDATHRRYDKGFRSTMLIGLSEVLGEERANDWADWVVKTAIAVHAELEAARCELEENTGDPLGRQCHEAEEALEAAQQALGRVVRLVSNLAAALPVTADDIAAAILGVDRRECRPGEPLALLNELALDSAP